MRECPSIGRVHRLAAVAAVLLGTAAVSVACAGPPPRQGSSPQRHLPAELEPGAVWIGAAKPSRVVAYEHLGERPTYELRNPDVNGTPLTFLVDGEDVDGEWIRVHLPVRPNGTKAWVRSQDLQFTQTQYKVEVDVDDHRLSVKENDEVVLESPIAVGKDSTPTPEGFFYIKELIKPEDPNTVYGAYAFGLSGFSEVIEPTWDETEGALAIHGTNDPKSIGTAVSNGCIRVPDDIVTRMTTLLPLGTPVKIES